MMGYHPLPDDPLFSYNVQLETRVRKDYPLRQIKQGIDFGFIYKEVADTYGTSGNVSVPPPVILKLMLLLVLYNVRSERELMETIPERLDWLWFLDYTIPRQQRLVEGTEALGREGVQAVLPDNREPVRGRGAGERRQDICRFELR